MLPHSTRSLSAGQALSRFVGYARRMLDPATPERLRRRLEPRLLRLLPVARALGLFELFGWRDPAMARLLRDEMEARRGPHVPA